MENIRIVIIHPYCLFNELLASFVGSLPQFCLLGKFPDCNQMINDSEILNIFPDIIILAMPPIDGENQLVQLRQETTQLRVKYPKSKILVLGQASETEVLDSIKCGASGYCLQGASLETLLQTIFAMGRGESLCSPKIAADLFAKIAEQPFLNISLTSREREILQLLDKSLSNKEIASFLNISVQTVKNHIHNLLQKLNLDGRKEAVRFARQFRLLETV